MPASSPDSRKRQKPDSAQTIGEPLLQVHRNAVALGMAVVSIALGLLPEAADISTQVTLLSVGLFALALAALQKA